jgi:hypothetical protein
MLYQLELLACKKRRCLNGVYAYLHIYLVSLCGVCFLQNRQYLLNSSLSGVVRLFLVVV